MVQVYLTEIQELPDPKESPEVMKGLSDARKEKVMRYRHADDRKRSLGAGLLLRKVLSCQGVDEDVIRYGRNGKMETDGICFNLSHGGDMVICAVSDSAVGCDIEKVRNAPIGVAKRFFCENELRYISSCSKEAQDRAFFRLWTMKESYIKMTGEGMSLPLDHFEMRVEDDVRVYRGGILQPCYIKEYETEDYHITVCAQEREFAAQIQYKSIVGKENML